MRRTGLTVRDIVLTSMCAALTAVLSQIVVPLPFTPIPINLATLSVFIAGGLLGPVNGGVSQIVYVLMGAVGIPVFAGFGGGPGILFGPSGGYIVGYVAAAFVIGMLKSRSPKSVWGYAFCMAAGALCIFVPGTAWFMFVTKTGLTASLSMCVIPFLPGDLMKIFLAAFLVKRLESATPRIFWGR